MSQNLEFSDSILRMESEILSEFQRFSRGGFVNTQSQIVYVVFSLLGSKDFISNI